MSALLSPLPILARALLIALGAWLCTGAARAESVAPHRVISMAPNITETVFALGAGDRLVAVTDFCNYPPAARTLRRAGGWNNPSFEVLTALRPDLILYQGLHQQVRDFAAARGLAAEDVDMDSEASIHDGILKLGRLLGVEPAATSLTLELAAERDRLRARVAHVPLAERPRVFLSLSRQPGALESLFTVSDRSFIGEAVAIAGGVNIFADAVQPYTQASKEALLAGAPQVILELQADAAFPEADRERLRRDWATFPTLPATRDGRIVVVAADYVMIPGPRMMQLARAIQQALYPALESE